MTSVARGDGRIGFYVWDYPGGGLEMVRHFWTAAAALHPAARDLTEVSRFPFCTPDGLTALARDAGLRAVERMPIELPTVFRDFDDYWRPFTFGGGRAPGYCARLAPDAREPCVGGSTTRCPARLTARSRSPRAPGRCGDEAERRAR